MCIIEKKGKEKVKNKINKHKRDRDWKETNKYIEGDLKWFEQTILKILNTFGSLIRNF